MSKKAEVLIQLLDKVPDSNKLQRLLEPENLLYLLQQYGYQREDLQQRLKNGMLPGELLLELLEQEPDSEYLLVMLSNTMDTKVEKRVVIDELIRQKKEEEAAAASAPVSSLVSAPAATFGTAQKLKPAVMTKIPASSASSSDEGSSNHYLTIPLIIISATSIAPALMQSDFSTARITPEVATLVAFVGGALAGVFYTYGSASAFWKGILLGIVFNLGVLWATIVYAQLRTSLFKLELVIPLALGSLPALGLYYLLSRKDTLR